MGRNKRIRFASRTREIMNNVMRDRRAALIQANISVYYAFILDDSWMLEAQN